MAALIIILGLVFGLAMLPQMLGSPGDRRPRHGACGFSRHGGEFARHILDAMKLNHVTVEETKLGDHYDPEAKVIRLMPENFNGRSLSAVVIAAHEAGHAMQDATGYAPLAARTRLAKQAMRMEKVAAVVMLAAPIVMVIAKSPHLLLMEVLFGALIFGSTILLHALTLPVELDASFRRALPVLKAGRYVRDEDMPAARSILRAAAFTYVAAAGMSLLDVMRWFRILRM